MTNKLPVVGRKYKHKDVDITLRISKIENDKVYVENYTTEFNKFLEQFKEIPEDKAETEQKLSEEVKETMEELKELKRFYTYFLYNNSLTKEELLKLRAIERRIHLTTDNLLNALNKQFGGKE